MYKKNLKKIVIIIIIFTTNKQQQHKLIIIKQINTKNENSFYKYTKTPKQQQYSNITLFSCFIFCGCNTNVDNGNT